MSIKTAAVIQYILFYNNYRNQFSKKDSYLKTTFGNNDGNIKKKVKNQD